MAGDYTASDTTETENDLELKKEVEERKLHRMAKVHNFSEMWQGSQNIGATQNESCANNKQMTPVEYISDLEKIVKPSMSLFQHDGAAAFNLSERSPLPPAMSVRDIPGGRTQVFNFREIQWTDRHPAETDRHSAPESISNIESGPPWNGHFDNRQAREPDLEQDKESDIEQYNAIGL